MSNNKHNQGKLLKLWPFLVQLHEKNPKVFEDAGLLRATVAVKWTALSDSEHCPNCGESMRTYIHKLDFFNAILLKEMGSIVLSGLKAGMIFHQANQVHVVSQDIHDCVRHRTTQCRTLGLIAKVEGEDGKHDREKGWLITKRGFAALRGEAVPEEVEVFRNQITERNEKTITLHEVFARYKGENEDLARGYDPDQWIHYSGIYQGSL